VWRAAGASPVHHPHPRARAVPRQGQRTVPIPPAPRLAFPLAPRISSRCRARQRAAPPEAPLSFGRALLQEPRPSAGVAVAEVLMRAKHEPQLEFVPRSHLLQSQLPLETVDSFKRFMNPGRIIRGLAAATRPSDVGGGLGSYGAYPALALIAAWRVLQGCAQLRDRCARGGWSGLPDRPRHARDPSVTCRAACCGRLS
jgi:hypothetical protein